MECDCGGKMMKSGTIMSGNSNYQLFKCEKCGKERMECIGLS